MLLLCPNDALPFGLKCVNESDVWRQSIVVEIGRTYHLDSHRIIESVALKMRHCGYVGQWYLRSIFMIVGGGVEVLVVVLALCRDRGDRDLTILRNVSILFLSVQSRVFDIIFEEVMEHQGQLTWRPKLKVRKPPMRILRRRSARVPRKGAR